MKEELPETVQPGRIKPPSREKLPEKGGFFMDYLNAIL